MVVLALFLSIIIVLFLVNKKINIGYSLVIGSLALAFLMGRSISQVSGIIIGTLTEATTLSLAVTIGLITILAHLMEKYLILDRMIISLEKILRSGKATILVAPAIMGTLLVSGGALMSCPIVGSLGDKLSISNDKKAAINLIFRHALYFVFPLSPTIILAAEIGGFGIWDFIKLQFPIAIALYIFGYFFLLKEYKEAKKEKINFLQYMKAIGEFLIYSLPIFISLLGVAIFKLPFYMSLVAGVISCIAINMYDKRKDKKYDTNEQLFITIYKGVKLPMVIAIIGIMLFKNTVNDIDEIFLLLNGMLEYGIPMELLILIATAIICYPLASTNAGIAILFPMILPLAPSYNMRLLYAMFIYTSSFMFYYISPLHLCQVLTLEYFHVKLKSLYKSYVYLLPITYIIMVAIYLVGVI